MKCFFKLSSGIIANACTCCQKSGKLAALYFSELCGCILHSSELKRLFLMSHTYLLRGWTTTVLLWIQKMYGLMATFTFETLKEIAITFFKKLVIFSPWHKWLCNLSLTRAFSMRSMKSKKVTVQAIMWGLPKHVPKERF